MDPNDGRESREGVRRIGFAHRGAPVSGIVENTLPAFQRALALGARGLESDVALTSDGVPVLVHSVISLRKQQRISSMLHRELPPTVPTLHDLFERCGADFDLALDLAAPGAAKAVVRVAREHGAANRLWLTYWHIDVMRAWREEWSDVRLVYATLPQLGGRMERTAERLRAVGVDALNMHHLGCRRSVREATASQDLLLFAWGIRSARPLPRLLALSVNGVFCDDVPAMVSALSAHREYIR